MKTSPQTKRLNQAKARAFTLIEMIGVLAVIAILAALLVPKVFSAISDARINSVCINMDTIKTATADHYGKYGKLDYQFGTNPIVVLTGGIYAGYDTNMLMPEGLIDKPFSAKISGGDPQLFSTIELADGAHANASGGYFLDGSANNSVANAQYVLQAVMLNVSPQDAKDLNDRIDGPNLGSPAGQADAKGRVEYAAPAGTPATTTVYVYLTHR